MTARILSIPVQDRDADVYVKVTLFEGKRVIKAKKTRLINISEEVCFNERFSILLPSTFLDGVSCVVSLCSRSALGVKQVLGRSSVGPYAFCSGLGLEQWQAGSSNSHQAIIIYLSTNQN
ncbi:synaptotagmin-15 [Eurytemora carolleeae]|uniref:synaptotagmin-15 n=1 Tax=Eurytemora carolleeae TaxID=1294199 RepID=UPI000C75BA7D|nr:synaptotagmin-15 [Eurytemora carolleeae]|eukprot:XP_023342455.1 synaptotagmin-15-like [Eurytemora affinis]